MSKIERWIGLILALLGGIAGYNLVFNNAYFYGATLADSTIYQTLIWRSDKAMTFITVFGGGSFFRTHFSPFLWFPNIFSYIFPGNHLQFYALVNGVIYAGGMYLGFRVLRKGEWHLATAVFGTLVFFCCQGAVEMGWEPRMEAVPPLLGIMTVWAWQERKYTWAIVWHSLNATVREDIALLFLAPILFIGLAQYLNARHSKPELAHERLLWVRNFALYTLALTIILVAIQKIFFPGFSLLTDLYYDPKAPFAHLTSEVLARRWHSVFVYRPGIWMPLVVMLVSFIFVRDWQLVAGALCFIPFFLFNFLSKFDLSGELSSYKTFPIVMMMMWPTLAGMVMPRLKQRLYRIVQAVVLGAGLCYVTTNYGYLGDIYNRWTVRPFVENGVQYQLFRGDLQELQKLGPLRASHGVMALYPYDFPVWYEGHVTDIHDQDIDKLKTIVYFDGDLDRDAVKHVLSLRPFQIKEIKGTKLRVATRKTE